jgi:hypothetical protein
MFLHGIAYAGLLTTSAYLLPVARWPGFNVELTPLVFFSLVR